MARPQLVFDEEMNHINALVDSARSWTSFFKRNVVWLFCAALIWSLAGGFLAARQTASYTANMSLTPFIDNVHILEDCTSAELNEYLLSDTILTGVLNRQQENGIIRDQLLALSADQTLPESQLLHQLRSYIGLFRSHDFSYSTATVVSPDLAFSTDLLRAYSTELGNVIVNSVPIDNLTFSNTIRTTIYQIAESLVVSQSRIADFDNNLTGEGLTEEQIEQQRQLESDARMDSIFYQHLLTQYAEEKVEELRDPTPLLGDLIKGDVLYTENRPARNKTFLIVILIGMSLSILILRARDLIRGSQAATGSAA